MFYIRRQFHCSCKTLDRRKYRWRFWDTLNTPMCYSKFRVPKSLVGLDFLPKPNRLQKKVTKNSINENRKKCSIFTSNLKYQPLLYIAIIFLQCDDVIMAFQKKILHASSSEPSKQSLRESQTRLGDRHSPLRHRYSSRGQLAEN